MLRILSILLVFLTLGTPGALFGQQDVDLKALLELENRVTATAKLVSPATVGVRAGRGLEGSGVLVSADGLVLTAAHVFRRPGDSIQIILPGGKVVRARALGKDDRADYGMIKILDKGPFPFVKIGKSDALRKRQLCVATGHPGGFKENRAPVFRLGMIGDLRGPFIQSTCIINSGDSGGPLFDIDGKLIGIHSRIRDLTSLNYHVPIDEVSENWKRLLNAEHWGTSNDRPTLGVNASDDPLGAAVERVYRNTPAWRAGLERGDIITSMAKQKIPSLRILQRVIRKTKRGQVIELEIIREGKPMKLKVTMGDSR